MSWTRKEFLALPQIAVASDIHCVTRWSRFDNLREGAGVAEILRRVSGPREAVAAMAAVEPGLMAELYCRHTADSSHTIRIAEIPRL